MATILKRPEITNRNDKARLGRFFSNDIGKNNSPLHVYTRCSPANNVNAVNLIRRNTSEDAI